MNFASFNFSQSGMLEVDIQEMVKLAKSVKFSIEKDEMNPIALKSPFHYYDTVKVCKRCYQVYDLFSTIHNKPHVEEVKKEQKVVDMNSLDYLLDDIQNLKFDMKYGESRDKFNELSNCSWNQASITRKQKNFHNTSILTKRATIDIKQIEEINYEELTEQIFPDAKLIHGQKLTDRGYYKAYISKLQLRSI